MKKKQPPVRVSEDDINLFKHRMHDVDPLPQEPSLQLQNSIRLNPKQAYRRQAACTATEAIVDGLTSEIKALVDAEDELFFCPPGIQLGRFKKLKNGHIPWDQGIDLHGYTLEQAREALVKFIRDASRARSRCVLVIHGKAFTETGSSALLKSAVNDWLQQLPHVGAFCSALPKDGGSGALYVLIVK